MAVRIFNPIYLLGPPLLLLVSIPLAIFAAVTTSLAIFVLTFRASLVYIELATAIIQSWVFKPKEKVHFPTPDFSHLTSAPTAVNPLNAAVAVRQQPHRRYPSSAAVSSNASSQDLSTSGANKKPLSRRESWLSIGGGSETRDYEGLGGWRIATEAGDDALWIGMNSRLELPAATAALQTAADKRSRRNNHTRSLTSTSQRFSWSPEMRMSPVQSRARTPSVTTAADAPQMTTQEYFDLQPLGKRPDSYPPGTATAGKGKTVLDPRRKSIGTSSTSSNGSAKGPAGVVKQTSFG